MHLSEIIDLVKDPHAADKLRLADSYMLQQQRVGRDFALPREHSDLLPIIDRYSKSFPKFVAYVKSVRDTVPPRSTNYVTLHELYRMLEVRLVQQERRERARRALMWLEDHHTELNYEQRQRWLRKLEQNWGKERMATLDAARRKTSRGRLSTEEREEILQQFWDEVDARVALGQLPKP